MASVCSPRRQLAPTVGPAAALARVHIRAGLLTISGERVDTALVDRILTMDFINDNTGSFANGGKFPKNGSIIEFGSFRVYYGTVPERQCLSPVLVAPDHQGLRFAAATPPAASKCWWLARLTPARELRRKA